MQSRTIVALDVPQADAALALATRLRGHVAMCKVGLEGFIGHGAPLVRRLREIGLDVFLDLKLHDIPRTAAAAAAQVADLDVRLLTVHAAGGPAMIQAVRRALPSTTEVVAVTILTSLDAGDMPQIGFAGDIASTARQMATMALANGADGIVCSPHELRHLAHLGGSRVVPGVRFAQTAAAANGPPAGDDQRRVSTPREAFRDGATWVVVGRPILQAADPVAAARAINAELP
jgi:orotidine-5'-phosphate decarboxylase